MQKTNFKTRLLALLTAVFMVIMCVPFAAFAEGQKTTVSVQFIDDTTNERKTVGTGTFEVEAKDNEIVDIPENILPEGYTFKTDADRQQQLWPQHKMVVQVKPLPAPTEQTVTVYYWDYTQSMTEAVASKEFKVAADAKELNITADMAPEGYDIAADSLGKHAINNGAVSIFVEKKAAPAEQTVTVYYWDYTQSKTEAVASKEFKVAADAKELNITADMAPEGYDIAADSLGKHAINNGAVSIFVEKKAAPAEQTVTVYYWDYTQSKTEAVASKEFKVAADAKELNITADMAPEGYDIAADSLGKHAINNGAVSIFVEKKAAPAEQTVTVYYWDYTQSKTEAVASKEFKVAADAEKLNVTADMAPEGYDIAADSLGEHAIINGTVSIFVEKRVVAKKTVHVHFFSDAVTEIGSVDINVNADATSITILDNMIPEGYALDRGSNVVEITKDQTQVSLFVSPVATPTKVTITVNMFDEANGVNGKPVKTYTVSADKNAKSITVDKAQIPTGYVKADDETFEKNVIGGKDDYVAFWIKKDAKAPEVADIHVYIKSSNNDLGTVTEKNIMLTKSELTGEYKAFALKATPKNGYHLTGWTVTADGKNVATVKADAATVDLSAYAEAKEIVVSANFEKNASTSASSTSSSSSNKTTTASNEKQVVKAAAAPANTTKVLPKTGASNVAPLLGGSLAVVALLMGYGVYSLVLRKKD